mgnify:CR=1 FL=1
MNLHTFFLMAPQAGAEGSGFTSLIFMGAIFVVFYFFIIRPQSKKQKEVQQKVSEMKKGDKVVTTSGMIGILNQIDDDSVLIEVGNSTKIRFLKSAINDVNPNKTEKSDKK